MQVVGLNAGLKQYFEFKMLLFSSFLCKIKIEIKKNLHNKQAKLHLIFLW